MLNDQTTTVAELRETMRRFVAEREWQIYHDPKNLSMSIAIEAAELMEHFQWLRSDQLDAVRQDAALMAEIRDELADILCFSLGMANALEIDVSAAIEQKMVKNASKYPAAQFKGRYHKPRT